MALNYNKIASLDAIISTQMFVLAFVLILSSCALSSGSSSDEKQNEFGAIINDEAYSTDNQVGTSTQTTPKYSKLTDTLNNDGLNQTTQSRQLPNARYEQDGDTRVPFWNIAHMINSIEQIEPALR